MLKSIRNYFKKTNLKKMFNSHIERSYGISESQGKYEGAKYLIGVADKNPEYLSVPSVKSFVEGLRVKYE